MNTTGRLSANGSEDFERRMHTALQSMGRAIADVMGPQFVALVLGGGYGRGEGACIVKDGKEFPYNDFDLFIITDGQVGLPREIHDITATYEKQLEIEVDIGVPLPIRALANLPHSLMFQDLLDGHVVIMGDPNVLNSHAPAHMADPLPAVEALRLLLNRGAGLLQAFQEASQTESDSTHRLPDPDFIRRNQQKCALALGDSLLIAKGLYRPPLHRRRSLLQQHIEEILPFGCDTILADYLQAADFKLNPHSLAVRQPNVAELKPLAQEWVRVLLWTEQLRTGRSWTDATSYADDTFVREPLQHTPRNIARNVVKQAKNGAISWKYPREALYGTLAVLLDEVQLHDQDWNNRANTFLAVWRTCN